MRTNVILSDAPLTLWETQSVAAATFWLDRGTQTLLSRAPELLTEMELGGRHAVLWQHRETGALLTYDPSGAARDEAVDDDVVAMAGVAPIFRSAPGAGVGVEMVTLRNPLHRGANAEAGDEADAAMQKKMKKQRKKDRKSKRIAKALELEARGAGDVAAVTSEADRTSMRRSQALEVEDADGDGDASSEVAKQMKKQRKKDRKSKRIAKALKLEARGAGDVAAVTLAADRTSKRRSQALAVEDADGGADASSEVAKQMKKQTRKDRKTLAKSKRIAKTLELEARRTGDVDAVASAADRKSKRQSKAAAVEEVSILF
jgi:hypothetical protein